MLWRCGASWLMAQMSFDFMHWIISDNCLEHLHKRLKTVNLKPRVLWRGCDQQFCGKACHILSLLLFKSFCPSSPHLPFLFYFFKGKPDLNTSLPVRQTASIFKQPVTKVTNHPNNKVKTDPQKAVDQPRQVSSLRPLLLTSPVHT